MAILLVYYAVYGDVRVIKETRTTRANQVPVAIVLHRIWLFSMPLSSRFCSFSLCEVVYTCVVGGCLKKKKARCQIRSGTRVKCAGKTLITAHLALLGTSRIRSLARRSGAKLGSAQGYQGSGLAEFHCDICCWYTVIKFSRENAARVGKEKNRARCSCYENVIFQIFLVSPNAA